MTPSRQVWRILRAELYELVWSEPMTAMEARFGVSAVAIGKACKRSDIPLPGRGYWAKVKAGRFVRRRSLPPIPFGMPDEIVFGGDGWSREHPDDVRVWTPPNRPSIAPEPLTSPDSLRKLRFRAKKNVGEVPIPYSMTTIYPLTERMIGGTHGDPQQPYVRPVDRRRLRLINAILEAAQRAGARPELPHDPNWFGLMIGRTLVRFKIDRVRSRGQRESSELDNLRLEIWPYRTAWTDRSDNLLDYHLQEIVAELFVSAD